MAGFIAAILLLCFIYPPLFVIVGLIFLIWIEGWKVALWMVVFGVVAGTILRIAGYEGSKLNQINRQIKRARKPYRRSPHKAAFRKALWKNLK